MKAVEEKPEVLKPQNTHTGIYVCVCMYACIHIRAHIQAVKEAEEKPELLKRHKLQDIGEKYLGQLVEAREFDQAASLCPR
jgi:hypothetical protein